MSSLEEIREERIKKAGEYPASVSRSFEIADVITKFSKIKKPIFVVGRIKPSALTAAPYFLILMTAQVFCRRILKR